MNSKNKHYVGIDFGTSNSYFCITPDSVLQPNAICFDNETSIETAVLWEEETIKDFGTTAVKGWGYAAPDEKKSWRLSLQFKPDISTSETAKKDAVAFFKSVAKDMKKRTVLPHGKSINQFPVIIGIPAKMLEGHKKAMQEIINEVGINNFKLVEEPVGALLHHIIRRDIRTEDVSRGILVIDFGGGTCDVAFMLRLDVKHKFGDPILGGRLFDDLFYRWFLDQNPDAESKLGDSGDSYFLHWVKCREMKETFSNTMRKRKNEIFKFHVPNYGLLNNATWDEFIHRAENYRPSNSFLEELKSFGHAYEELTSIKSINLIQRFRDAIKSSISSGKVKIENIEQIILTGGSSSWPFVREIVSEIFFLENDKILESANPRAAIGEGLALLPIIQDKYNNIKDKLEDEKGNKVLEVTNRVMADIRHFCDEISDDIVQKIFNEAVQPAINSFSENGGTLEQLNLLIESKVESLKPEFEKVIEVQKPEIEAKIVDRIVEILNNWFVDHNIKGREFENINLNTVDNSNIKSSQISPPMELDFIVSTVVGLITASLLGGGGIALLSSGPGGWFIGLGLGTVGTFLGMKKIKAIVPIPGMIMKNFVVKKGLDISLKRAKTKTKERMTAYMIEQFDKNKEKIEKQIEGLIEDQIKSLDAINSI